MMRLAWSVGAAKAAAGHAAHAWRRVTLQELDRHNRAVQALSRVQNFRQLSQWLAQGGPEANASTLVMGLIKVGRECRLLYWLLHVTEKMSCYMCRSMELVLIPPRLINARSSTIIECRPQSSALFGSAK
jgi:hypothetical protein